MAGVLPDVAPAFLAFTNGRHEMAQKEWVRLCTNIGLVGGGTQLTVTDMDLIFTKAKTQRARKLSLPEFELALVACAKRARVAPLKIFTRVVETDGPVFVTKVKPTSNRGPERFFYDKSQYTGVHVHGGPTVVDAGRGGLVADISQLCDRSKADSRGVKEYDSEAGRRASSHTTAPQRDLVSAQRVPRGVDAERRLAAMLEEEPEEGDLDRRRVRLLEKEETRRAHECRQEHRKSMVTQPAMDALLRSPLEASTDSEDHRRSASIDHGHAIGDELSAALVRADGALGKGLAVPVVQEHVRPAAAPSSPAPRRSTVVHAADTPEPRFARAGEKSARKKEAPPAPKFSPPARARVGARPGARPAGAPRGPERFFYDKSLYTGVHTKGGPDTGAVAVRNLSAITRGGRGTSGTARKSMVGREM